MQTTYELTEKDFTEAYTAHRNGKAISRWSRCVVIFFVVLMTAILLLELVLGHFVLPAKTS